MDIFEALSSVLMIACSTLGIFCAFVFIIVVITHRQCHTITILLVLNSSVAGLIANMTCLCQAVYQLKDLGDDLLCTVRGLLLQVGTGVLYHTLVVQALHRLFVTVYSTRRSMQTKRFNIYMVVTQWMFSATFGLPILLMDRIKYFAGSRICQVSLEDTINFMYLAVFIFLLPLLIIVFVYIRIVLYMKSNPYSSANHSTTEVAQRRQQSELRLIRRVLILVVILFVLGFPYFFFALTIRLNLLTLWPSMQRISYLFITFGQSASMVINLITTDNVRQVLVHLISQYCDREARRQSVNTISGTN